MYVFVEMPPSIALETGQQVLGEVRRKLMEFPEVTSTPSEQGRPEDGMDNEGINMAPGVNRGTVYVSTGPGNADAFFGGGGAGVLWALDARTGRTQWKFNTVPHDLWGNPDINSGGGVWFPPSFDARGSCDALK